MVGEMPVKRWANSFCCFTWINGVDLRYGSTADQGRTEEKIPPLGCGAQHEHQAPTQSEAHQLGTARWACVRAGKCLLTPRPYFTAPSCTLGNQVVAASDGPPLRQECRPTRVCRKNRGGRHAQREGDVAAERDPN